MMTTDAASLGLDPLIAEAKRRARRRRFLALAAVVAAVAAVAIWVEIPSSKPAAVGRGDLSARGPIGPVYYLGTSGGVTWVVTWAGRNQQLWLSTTDGRTWLSATPSHLLNAPARVNAGVDDVQFVDHRHGWITSDELVKGGRRWELDRTTDGGRTWQTATPTCGRCDAVSDDTGPFTFFDAEHGDFVAYAGGSKLFSTSDGGATWSRASGRSRTAPREVTWVDSRHAIADSWGIGPGGYVGGDRLSRTSDGGRTWTPVALEGKRTYPGLFLHPGITSADGTLVIPAERRFGSHLRPVVYTSSDDGAHWQAHSGPLHVSLTVFLDFPDFLFSAASPDTWVATGGSDRHLFETTDGGKSWRVVKLPRAFRNPKGELNAPSIDFTSARVGWAVLQSAELVRTTDGGRHWALASRPEPKAHQRG